MISRTLSACMVIEAIHEETQHFEIPKIEQQRDRLIVAY
jgi:hypothetical protein